MGAGLRIDHVLYAVRDLDEAASRLATEWGLATSDGGRHPGHGTANRIVPLGSDYIELIAIVDQQEASRSPIGRAVTARTAAGEGLIGWAVRTDDIDAQARRLSLPVQTMRRSMPDGREVSWDLAGVAQSLARPEVPFFIRWHEPDQHPGRLSGDDVPRGHIAWIALHADLDEIVSWVGGADLPLRAAEGGRPMSAGLTVGDREILLR